MDAKGGLQPRKDDQAESGKQELVVMDVEGATAFPEADIMAGRNILSKDAEQSLSTAGEDRREEAHSLREGDNAPNVPGMSSEIDLYSGNESNGDAASHRPTEPTAIGGDPEGPLDHAILAAQPPNTADGSAENDTIKVKSPSDGDGNPDVVMTDVTQPSNEEAATSSDPSILHQPRKRPAPTQSKEEPAPPLSPGSDKQKPSLPPSVEKDSVQDTAMADATTEPTRRSGRRTTRRTYREEDSDAEFDPAPTPPSKTKTTPASVSESKRGGNSRIWKPDYLLQDPKSKLTKVDVTVYFPATTAHFTLLTLCRLSSKILAPGLRSAQRSSPKSSLCFLTSRLLPRTPLTLLLPSPTSHNRCSPTTMPSAPISPCSRKT